MSGIRHGIATNAITWEQGESSIEYTQTNEVRIRAVGSVGVSDSATNLLDALELLPATLPVTSSGPIGDATEFAGATLTMPRAQFNGDDTIRVECVFVIANPTNQSNQDTGLGTIADSDKATRQIVTEDAPLLAHPIVESFPETDRVLLRALVAGEVVANDEYSTSATEGAAQYEFVRLKDNVKEEVDFDASTVTDEGVSASPLDYARLLASGVDTYRRPIIRHTLVQSRNAPALDADYETVGEVVDAPNLAPAVGKGRDWFLNGITDETTNGEAWTTSYEYEASGEGGALKAIYKGGSKEIT